MARTLPDASPARVRSRDRVAFELSAGAHGQGPPQLGRQPPKFCASAGARSFGAQVGAGARRAVRHGASCLKVVYGSARVVRDAADNQYDAGPFELIGVLSRASVWPAKAPVPTRRDSLHRRSGQRRTTPQSRSRIAFAFGRSRFTCRYLSYLANSTQQPRFLHF